MVQNLTWFVFLILKKNVNYTRISCINWSVPQISLTEWITTLRRVLWVKMRLVHQHLWINWKEKWTYTSPVSGIIHMAVSSRKHQLTKSLFFIWINSSAGVFEEAHYFYKRRRFVKLVNYRPTFRKRFLDCFKCLAYHLLPPSLVTVNAYCR